MQARKAVFYCSASYTIDPKYNQAARDIVRAACLHGYGIVSGGTVKGTMAVVCDEAMKAAGIGWLKRKAMKAAMAIMPAENMAYTVKGNMIILHDGQDRDTLRLSSDGKSLSGKTDGIGYTLARTK